jgi:hypothetical protein
MDFPYTIKLFDPIEFGAKLITELVIPRAPKTKDFYGISTTAPQIEDFMKAGSRLCDVPFAVMGELSWADTKAVIAVVNSFFEDGQEIGSEQ